MQHHSYNGIKQVSSKFVDPSSLRNKMLCFLIGCDRHLKISKIQF